LTHREAAIETEAPRDLSAIFIGDRERAPTT
jgi:hypothetical protein